MKTRDEIIHQYSENSGYDGGYSESDVEKMLDEYAKEVSVDFFKWNALKVDEYVRYLQQVNRADGINEKEQEASRFEGAPISVRFDLYQQKNSSLK